MGHWVLKKNHRESLIHAQIIVRPAKGSHGRSGAAVLGAIAYSREGLKLWK